MLNEFEPETQAVIELTQGKMLREESTPGEVAHHVPHVRQTNLSPGRSYFALFIQAPNGGDFLAVFRSKEFAKVITYRAITM